MASQTTNPSSVVVFGGGSDIARALLVQLAQSSDSLRSVALMGPHRASLEITRHQLLCVDPTLRVIDSTIDFSVPQGIDSQVQALIAELDGIDCAIMAAGWLGHQEQDEHDPEQVSRSVAINFQGPAIVLTRVAQTMEQQGHGLIIVLSSVAGERVRRSNYVYGSTKAGLDGFTIGMGERLRPTVRVILVRPGFVQSAMTQSLRVPPLATVPDRVAADIIKAMATDRDLVWTPAIMRPIMSVYRHLPRWLARQIPY